MGKETVSLKLDAEMAEKFKMLQKKFESAQDFIKNALPVLENQFADDSPIQKEKMQLQQSFRQTERIALSFLEITANEKKQVIENAENEKKKLQEKIIDLGEKIDKRDQTIIEFEKKEKKQNKILAELVEKNKAMHESAETIFELKIAWKKLEAGWERERKSLTTQIAQLKKENKKK